MSKEKRLEPWQRAVKGLGVRSGIAKGDTVPPSLPQGGVGESEDLARYRSLIVEMALRGQTLAGPPFGLGFVLRVNPEDAPVLVTKEVMLDVNDHVRIVTCDNTRLVDNEALVVAPPDEESTVVTLALFTGDVVNFRLFDSAQGTSQIVLVKIPVLTAIVSYEGRDQEVKYLPGLKIVEGSRVRLNVTTRQIVGLALDDVARGDTANVVTVLADGRFEVSVRNGERVVIAMPGLKKISVGDHVVLDTSNTVIIGLVEQGTSALQLTSPTGIDWSDIGGQDEAVGLMRDAIEDMAQNPNDYIHYNLDQPNGILIDGPPGTGKTLLCRAAATAMARAHGFDRPMGFLLVRGPEFLESLVGKGEKRLRACHDWLRRFFAEYGFRGMFVIDECEGAFKRRGSGISSDATDHLVNTQLGQTNRFSVGDPIVVYVTNRPDLMDEALIRDERVDVFIHMGRPSQASAKPIFAIHLRKRPLAEGVTAESLAEAASVMLFDPKYALYRIDLETEGSTPVLFTLGSVSSGAMIVTLTKDAARRAMKEGRTMNPPVHVPIGIRHLEAAIEAKFEDSARRDHRAALTEMRQTITDPIKEIVRLKQQQS